MKVIIFDPPKNIENKIAVAAKMCYSASNIDDLMEKISKQDQEKFIRKIISIGHHSVLEHVELNFAVEGISRVLSHQLVRHRIASYSQQSQRYVKLDETFEYITPESIRLSPRLSMKYDDLMDQIHDLYKDYLNADVPAEDARYILPNATETKIFITMNLRVLLHFFNVRCCNRAQWEIRAMAIEMLKQCKELSQIIFESSGPSCIGGNCGEGEMTCGDMGSVRNKFKEM
ncbi:MAG: FAD-dependent thymidylate synthase [Candidatus Scalindua sp.]|jgi:thymidylate synthase (FAD)|nr:FAD-dependent thymidylate synthase [Candidatus Scalindua sp.]